jgi:hypothetical protein
LATGVVQEVPAENGSGTTPAAETVSDENRSKHEGDGKKAPEPTLAIQRRSSGASHVLAQPDQRLVPNALPTADGTRAQEVNRSHTLYREAHRLHFQERDCVRAIPAWDRYLGQAPDRVFAPESRYNRALCLVRVGRRSEAQVALEPFASGEYGAYRQKEAQSLLDELRR